MKALLAAIISLVFLFSCQKKTEKKIDIKDKTEKTLPEKPKKDSCICDTKIKKDSIFYGTNLKIEAGQLQFNCAEISVTNKMHLDTKTKSTFCRTDVHVYCVSENQEHVAIDPKLNINKVPIKEKSFYLFKVNPKKEIFEIQELRQD